VGFAKPSRRWKVMQKKTEEERIPSIQVADKEAVKQIQVYIENYLIKDSEHKRLSLE